MRKFLLVLITAIVSFNSIAQVSNADAKKALQLVNSSKVNLGLSAEDLNNVLVTTTYFDKSTGLTMVYLQQTYAGIPVLKQIMPLAFKNGRLISKAGIFEHNMDKIANVKSGIPVVSAASAVQYAIGDRKLSTTKTSAVISSKENGRKIEYNNMGVSRENITAELLWVPVEASVNKETKIDTKGTIRLAWQVYIIPNNSSDYWLVYIDAVDNKTIRVDNLTDYDNWGTPGAIKAGGSGAITEKILQTNQAENDPLGIKSIFNQPNESKPNSPAVVNTSSYRVIPFPAESPLVAAPAIRTNPWTAAPGNATTLGWHTGLAGVDYNYTRGNNAWAYSDRDGIDGGTLAETVYSTTTSDPLTFDFAPNFAVDPVQAAPAPNKQFNVTNLFYWTNIVHDVMYQYGFDEPAHNFQDDNLGRGGTGNDHVNAEAQDNSGTNNANFSTPNDGSPGRMQMYLFDFGGVSPNRDGDVDNGIVVHEYGHGISNRLTGGGATVCLSGAEQMGEGWSDYYALMFTTNWATATATDGFNVPRQVGNYALAGFVPFPCPYAAPVPPCTATPITGFRRFPYTTNMAVNPWVYASTIPSETHDRGEIWAATLWDMTWNIIAQDGINPNLYNAAGIGGNTVALRLVTLGLKLQPCSVGFIDGRNAILAADDALYGGAHRCAIINAFARRGMGLFASQGSSNSVTDQVPDFTAEQSTVELTTNAAAVPESQQIVYTNNVTAGGADCVSLTNYTLTDTLPDNVTYVSGGSYNPANRVVSFNPVTVAPSTTQPYTFTVNINSGAYFPPDAIIDEQVTGATIPAFWTETSTTATHWTVSNAQSHSAPNSFFSPDIASVSDQVIATTASFSLDGAAALLSLWHYYNSENGYDGGVVEISLDGGTNWQDIGAANFVSGGYNAVISNAYGSPIANRRAFTGNSNGFIKSVIDMQPYSNQPNVKVRFRFSSDNSNAGTGWYVDDITLIKIPVVKMRSSLFNAADVRISKADVVASIVAPLPAPVINAGAVTGSIVACFGSVSANPAVQQFTVSGDNLTAGITVNAPTNFEVSTDAGSGYGSSLTLTPTVGNVPGTVIYVRSAATAPAGPVSGDVSLVSAGVTTIQLAVSGTIKPIPDATATPSSQNSCSGAAITNIQLNSAVSGTGFSWSRDNTAMATGIADNGTTDISGTLTNTTSSPVMVTFTVTPTAAGCTGAPIDATVTVNPRPTSLLAGDQTVCSDNLFANLSVTFTGAAPWTFTIIDGTTPVTVPNINTNPFMFSVSSVIPQTYTVTSLNDANCAAIAGDLAGSATLTQLSYNIDAIAGANGTISPNSTTVVNCGASQTYTITANSCYTIADVLVDGISQGAISTYTFSNVTAAHMISVTFSQLTYSISASAGANGTVTPTGGTGVNCGNNLTFNIAANNCYLIADVLVDGISQGTINTYTFSNVTTTHTISATFSKLSYSISATSGANGTVTPAGSTSVSCGTNQTYTITANGGYSIADVLVDGVSVGAVGTYTFTNVNTTHTISASFAAVVVNYNITATSGANGTVTPAGTSSVVSGTNKTYTITANGGYSIADVLVDGVSVGAVGTYTFTNVTTTHTISASFVAIVVNYTINASAGANGSISPGGAVSVVSGANQTFTITANAGYTISNVLVDGSSVGAVGTYTFTNVTTTHTISASFAAVVVNYNITATSGANGTVTPAGTSSVVSGTNKTYTITANAGFTIADVLVDGSSVGSVGTYTFTNVTTTHTISASFAAVVVNYNITATSGANGTVTPAGTSNVVSGTNKTYTITANGGYSIADVLVDGSSVGSVGTYTFTNVVAAHTISASFAAVVVNYNITASSGANGTVTPAGTSNVVSGTNKTYTITANGGYSIADVLVDGSSVGSVGTYTFTNVVAAHTISASFAAVVVNYNITASSGANGTVTPAGTSNVVSGTNKTYTITANGGYTIANVLVDGSSVGAVGTYTFTGVTTTHTISASFVAVSGCTAPSLSAVITKVTCKGSSTGAINLTATGGTAPYTYAWSKPGFTATTEDLTGLVAGTYTVVVTATGGCTATANYVVTESSATLTATFTAGTISCFNGTTSVTVSAAGGTAPYTGTGTITNQAAGNHSYTVADANGCSVTSAVMKINQPAPVSVTATAGTLNCSGTTSVVVSATGGTAPYTGTGTFTNQAPGGHTYVVTDALGCTASRGIYIAQGAPASTLAATATPGVISCNGGTTSVVVSATGGTAPYTGTGTITNQTAGTKTFTVSDAAGCTTTVTVTITQPAKLAVTAVPGAINCFGGTTSVVVSATGGTAPYTGTGTITNQASGNNTYTVTDSKGCTASVTVKVNQPAPISVTATAGTISCNGGTTSVTISATGGTAPYTGTGTLTGQAAGPHTYVVTDSKGCSFSRGIYIANGTGTCPPVSPKNSIYTSNDVLENGNFRITPNPVQSNATVSFTSAKKNIKFEVRIKDATGRTLLAIPGYTLQGTNTVQFSMAKLAGAFYTVSLITNNSIQTKKIIKAK